MSDLIPQRTDEVVLYRDEDQHEIDRLRRAVEAAAETAKERIIEARLKAGSSARIGDEAPAIAAQIGDDPDLTAAAEAYDEFVAAAAERGVKVVVKNLPGRKWRALVAEHPPREGNLEDEEWGWNVPALGDAVVAPSVVSINGQAVQDAEAHVDAMTDGDFSRVYSAVRRLNTGRGPDPKESISAMLPRTSRETSESPERLG